MAVVNLPWLNRVDEAWVRTALAGVPMIVTIDNHYVSLGQGVSVAAALARAEQVPTPAAEHDRDAEADEARDKEGLQTRLSRLAVWCWV